jgi:hypothetical protein
VCCWYLCCSGCFPPRRYCFCSRRILAELCQQRGKGKAQKKQVVWEIKTRQFWWAPFGVGCICIDKAVFSWVYIWIITPWGHGCGSAGLFSKSDTFFLLCSGNSCLLPPQASKQQPATAPTASQPNNMYVILYHHTQTKTFSILSASSFVARFFSSIINNGADFRQLLFYG